MSEHWTTLKSYLLHSKESRVMDGPNEKMPCLSTCWVQRQHNIVYTGKFYLPKYVDIKATYHICTRLPIILTIFFRNKSLHVYEQNEFQLK